MAAYSWPTRSYISGVSNFDWSTQTVSNDQYTAWSKGVVAEISIETGRAKSFFTSLDDESLEADCAAEIWQMMMEQRYVKRREDVMESEYDDTYSSLGVSGYSENKPSLKERNPLFYRMANSSPEIARKLWFLMTETKRNEIRALAGEVVPQEYVQETDWFEVEPYLREGGWWNF